MTGSELVAVPIFSPCERVESRFRRDGSSFPIHISYFAAQKGETAWRLGTVSQFRVRMRP